MMTKLCDFINERHSLCLKVYHELWKYSTDSGTAHDFWVDVYLFLGMKGDKVPSISIPAKVR